MGIAVTPVGAVTDAHDGFSGHKTLNGHYFSVHLEDGVDPQQVAMRIAVTRSTPDRIAQRTR